MESDPDLYYVGNYYPVSLKISEEIAPLLNKVKLIETDDQKLLHFLLNAEMALMAALSRAKELEG